MPKKKFNFLRDLYEFDGGGVGNAFSANVLGTTQLTQDPMKDEEDKKSDKEIKLRKEIEDALSKNHEEPEEDDKSSADQRVLSMLKNLLFHEKGYEYDDSDDDSKEPHDDTPSDNDHEEFADDEQLPNGGIDPNTNKPGNYSWNPKSKTLSDTKSGPAEPEDKHAQLIAAIKDLKQEITRRRGRNEDFIEQEEDVEEEDEGDDTTQYANAQKMFQSLINQKMSRGKVIAAFEKNLGVTNSTAVSYYQRLAKDAGLTNSGDREMPGPPPGLGQAASIDPNAAVAGGNQPAAQPPPSNVSGNEVPNDPNRQGLIRQVDGAHLVYKRKNEEGTYDELWVFGTGDEIEDSLKVRRNILAGTDIAPRSTKSANGTQSYTLNTLGTGQLLCIKGLPN
jgi:hypothetical protein